MRVSKSQKQKAKQYLQNYVNPILLPLVKQIINNKPSQQLLPMLIFNYVTALQKSNESCNLNIQNEKSDLVDQAQFNQKLQKRNKKEINCKGSSSGRLGISAQVYSNLKQQDLNKKDSKKLQKSQDVVKFIRKVLFQSFLFQNQLNDSLDKIIKVMEVKQVKCGETIIKQGQVGNTLFLVYQGIFNCFKFVDGKLTYLKAYKSGQIFGQLSIMYNLPRQATIIAKTSGKLYTLDRYHFNTITRQNIEKKRLTYKQALSKVEILQGFTDFEKQKICDVLKQQKYQIGQYIFQQGEQGEKFYFLLQGRVIAEKKVSGQQIPQNVYQFKTGDYFGQIALIKNCTRQASIKAISKCRVVYLNRQTFKRLFGSLEQKLKKNQSKYSNSSMLQSKV